MAAKTTKKPEKESAGRSAEGEGDQAKPAKGRGRFSVTTMAIVGGILVMQVAAIGVWMWLSRGPSKASAEQPAAKQEEKPAPVENVEEPIVEGKATNTKRGATVEYRFKVYGVVSVQDQAAVKAIIEKRKATIEDTVRQVVARLEPRDLEEEPELTTVRRVLIHELEPVFGAGKVKDLLMPVWAWRKLEY